MNGSMKLPRISFKGVFIFMMIVILGNFLLVKPFQLIGLGHDWSLFWANAAAATIGMSLVLLLIDDKVKDRALIFKRLILSIIVSFGVSYFLVFMA
ncbi:hypothetical protein [Falsibacillus pallidus]|uniref:hypothetical protein n=1 Tax=Falsibacillus pallidus TaxID=493781 RepID=UPI003D98C089